jgi:hypothetical protein
MNSTYKLTVAEIEDMKRRSGKQGDGFQQEPNDNQVGAHSSFQPTSATLPWVAIHPWNLQYLESGI